MNIIDSPEAIVHAMDMIAGAMNDLAVSMQNLSEAEARMIGGGPMSLHQKMLPDNWTSATCRRLSSRTSERSGTRCGAVSPRTLQPTPFLERLNEPLGGLGCPAPRRLASPRRSRSCSNDGA